MDPDFARDEGRKPGRPASEGRYANYLAGGINATEFVLDFGQCYQGEVGPRIHTRIVTTPAYMKAFVELLQDCIADYEVRYGAISELPDVDPGPPQPQERRG